MEYVIDDEPGLSSDIIAGVNLSAADSNTDELQKLVFKYYPRKCLLHLSAHDVLTARSRYMSLRGNEQQQWLMDRFCGNSHEEEKGKLCVGTVSQVIKSVDSLGAKYLSYLTSNCLAFKNLLNMEQWWQSMATKLNVG